MAELVGQEEFQAPVDMEDRRGMMGSAEWEVTVEVALPQVSAELMAQAGWLETMAVMELKVLLADLVVTD